MPAVSVVMVCHRDTEWLRPAIASVFAQTLKDLELVLVDNGAGLSVQSLGELGRDSRLRWVQCPKNFGIPKGHNLGIAAARGEHIALLDHDDLMLPQRLERQVALLTAEPSLGLVASRAATVDQMGRIIGREFALLDGAMQHRYTQFGGPVVTPAYTGRRNIFQALPYREEFTWAADFDFLARAAEQFKFSASPEVLLHYRRHAGQTTVVQAASIAHEQCVIRLLTARRRAHRPENLLGAGQALEEARGAPRDVASMYAQSATDCLREGLVVLAVYHARKMLAIRRDISAVKTALEIYGAALRLAPREAGQLSRLFFTGPLRAYGFKSAEVDKIALVIG